MAAEVLRLGVLDDRADSGDLFGCISLPSDVVIDNPVVRIEVVAWQEAGRVLQRALAAGLIASNEIGVILALKSQERDLRIIDLREGLDKEAMLKEMLAYAQIEGVLNEGSVKSILAIRNLDQRDLLILRSFVKSLSTGKFNGELGYHLYAHHHLLEALRCRFIDESFLHQVMRMEPDKRDLIVLDVEWELRHVEQLLSVLSDVVAARLITKGQQAQIMDMPDVYQRDLLIYKLENLLAVIAKFRALKAETVAIADEVRGKAGGNGGLGVLN